MTSNGVVILEASVAGTSSSGEPGISEIFSNGAVASACKVLTWLDF